MNARGRTKFAPTEFVRVFFALFLYPFVKSNAPINQNLIYLILLIKHKNNSERSLDLSELFAYKYYFTR